MATIELVITDVSVTDCAFAARLADRRTISVPPAWSSRLSNVAPELHA
ncbi:MAG: hypothetical protein ACREWE_09980 [Gammaproteobacteria bacterium]